MHTRGSFHAWLLPWRVLKATMLQHVQTVVKAVHVETWRSAGGEGTTCNLTQHVLMVAEAVQISAPNPLEICDIITDS